MANEFGIALVKANYLLSALAKKEFVMIQNLGNKMRSTYIMTPAGLSTKVEMISELLRRKMAERVALWDEIESLGRKMTLGAKVAPAPGVSA